MKTLPVTPIAIPADQINERIVAEITTTWQNGQTVGPEPARQLLATKFEKVIAFNQSRGYPLESWNMTSILYTNSTDSPSIIETIVAVFKRDPTKTPASQ